ncbi:MAG TPA: methyltransferase domain-containing protein [Dermatophilaceae bacterium]|nr:methyltransferase domain-containing protein [Dermatophilaceae bacterium]
MDDDATLIEQIAYYRARAGEYDDFWLARGAYSLPADLRAQWFEDAAEAEAAVSDWAPRGNVLDLACGTGLWTQFLVRTALSVTAVDSSPEVLELNRRRLSALGSVASVAYAVADIFAWDPGRRDFDAVLLGYWHSHVPDERLDQFWAKIDGLLRPGGTVMLIDSCPWPPHTAAEPVARAERRTLSDGSSYHVVKRYWAPGVLSTYLASQGWHAEARTTQHGMILLATVTRAAARMPSGGDGRRP